MELVHVALSANTPQELRMYARALANQTRSAAQARWSLADIAVTLNRRRPLTYRVVLPARDMEELTEQLVAVADSDRRSYRRPAEPLVAFSYTGQGSHTPAMGRSLMRNSRAFSLWVEEAISAVGSIGGSLREILLTDAPVTDNIAVSAPAIFVFQVGVQRALHEAGVEPQIVCGHSLGEYAAAVAAGVFSARDALDLVVERSRLMQEQTPPGAMVALLAPVDRALALASKHGLAVAAVNGATETVLSGTAAAVRALVETANRDGILVQPLRVGRAFHSPAMLGIANEFRSRVDATPGHTASIRFVRALAGGNVSEAANVEAGYWVDQLHSTVHFADIIKTVATSGDVAVLEIGSQPVLTKFAAEVNASFALSVCPRGADADISAILAALWERGYVDAIGTPEGGRRIHLVLPTDNVVEVSTASSVAARPTRTPTAVERAVADAWYETVGVQPSDNLGYLAAGGDSLRALRFSELVSERTGADVPLRALLEDDPYRTLLKQIEATASVRDELESSSLTGGGIVEDYPPTPIQSRMLTAAEVGAVENVTAHLVFDEAVDSRALREAFDDLQASTAVLRSRFSFTDDGWRAAVAAQPLATLQMVPGESVRLPEVLEAAAVPLTSASPAPLNAWLLAPSDGPAHLVIVMHHAVSDATSMALVLERLDAAYESRRRGLQPTLATDNAFVKIASNASFHSTTRVVTDNRRLARLAYQQEQSFAFDRGPRATADPTSRSVGLDRVATASLRSAAAERAATPSAWILTAIALTMRVFDPAENATLSVGLPVDVRRRYRAREACGPLIDLVPISWDSVTTSSFETVLQRTQGEILEAIELGGVDTGESNYSDPFAIFTTVPNLKTREFKAFTPVQLESTHSKYAMSWWFEDGVTATIGVEFDAGRIDSRVAESILDVVVAVAVEAQTNPRGHGTGLWQQRSSKALSVDGGPGAVYQSIAMTIRQRLSEDPSRIVLRGDGAEVTAGDLLASAENIARAMRGLGVGPGALVVLRLGPTVELIKCLLATIFAGGAYLPIDAEPVGSVQDALSRFDIALTVGLDDCGTLEASGKDSDVRLGGADSAADLAYVILTSGSTGVPKGVAVTRGSLWNYLHWAGATYSAENANFALVSSPAVDLSVTALLLPLVGKGSIWLPGQIEATTIVRASLAAESDNGFIKATPTHLELLLGASEEAPPWRVYILGGEQLSGPLLSDLIRRRPDAIVVNEFGPTEATVGCVIHIAGPADTTLATVPIGRPVPGCAVEILDADGREVPFGAVGELVISGEVLAESYYQDRERTARAFPTINGRRTYRSGDLVRWEENALVYLGRTSASTRLKLRGQRIEIGAIEHELRRIEGLSAAKVFVERDSAGQPASLTAYVVGDSRIDVQASLASRLRAAEIPGDIRWVDQIPQSRSGKAATETEVTLPTPARGRSTADNMTTISIVRDAFVRTLGRTVDDNRPLVDQGAHSMARLKVYAALRERFPSLRLQGVFEFDSIVALAQSLDGGAELSHDMKTMKAPSQPAKSRLRTHGRLAADLVITGANGLVGSSLVIEALEQGKSVLALARGTSTRTATDRVLESMKSMGAVTNARPIVVDTSSEPVPVEIDLKHCGSIIHAAGDIRHFGSTDAFVQSNVDLTSAWATAAAQAGRPLLYLSSSGLDGAERADSILRESPYLQSKLDAEALLHTEPGLVFAIIRLGSVVGRSDTGRILQDPQRIRVYRILHAIITSGVAPVDLPWGIDVSPADLAARAILKVSDARPTSGARITIENERSLHFDQLAVMMARLGYPLKAGTRNEMIQRLQGNDDAVTDALMTIAAWIPEANDQLLIAPDQLANGYGVLLPAIDTDLLGRLLQGAIERGMPVSAPMRGPTAALTGEELNESGHV